MSWYEVETKVRVRDPKALRKVLKEVGAYRGIETKKDTYYALDNNKKSPPKLKLRVRDKGDLVEVNYKKSYGYIKGVHSKKETEMNISDKKNFIELIEHFGFEEYVKKHKKTELYVTKDGIGLELNHVKGLGWYLEIEILCKKGEVERARKRIVTMRERLGLSEKDVEKRGYTREMWENKHKK